MGFIVNIIHGKVRINLFVLLVKDWKKCTDYGCMKKPWMFNTFFIAQLLKATELLHIFVKEHNRIYKNLCTYSNLCIYI